MKLFFHFASKIMEQIKTEFKQKEFINFKLMFFHWSGAIT